MLDIELQGDHFSGPDRGMLSKWPALAELLDSLFHKRCSKAPQKYSSLSQIINVPKDQEIYDLTCF